MLQACLRNKPAVFTVLHGAISMRRARLNEPFLFRHPGASGPNRLLIYYFLACYARYIFVSPIYTFMFHLQVSSLRGRALKTSCCNFSFLYTACKASGPSGRIPGSRGREGWRCIFQQPWGRHCRRQGPVRAFRRTASSCF